MELETSMDSLVIEVESVSKNATTAISNLITKLDELDKKLQNVVNSSKNFSKLNSNISNATQNVSGATKKVSTKTQQPFKEYGTKESQFQSLGINESDLTQVISTTKTATQETTKYKTALGQTVTVIEKTNNGLKGYKVTLSDVNSTTKKGTSIFKAMTSGLSGTLLQANLIWHSLKSTASMFGSLTTNAASYYEAFNLFTTTLGENAQEGLEWVEMFSDALYLDAAPVMQYMGSFNSLIKGLGVGTDRAYLMSQQLTQLTYDLASFKNLDFETAFQKLQSGISGEIEPLRNVGVVLSEATLQELAYSLGLEENVSDMNEAEKAQLRYIQIMKSSTEWQADMGKTLTSPANALRVIKEQFTLLGRAIGNVFIPILMTLIPYVMVVTEWLNQLANTLANFLSDIFGVDLDFDFNTSGFDTSVGDVTGGLGDIGAAADDTKNKLNTMLAPFDELNNVQTQSKSDGSGAGAGGVGGDLGVDLPTYDALSKLTDQFSKNIEKARQNLEGVLKVAAAVGATLLAWKIAKGVSDFITSLSNMKNSFSTLNGWVGKLGTSLNKVGWAKIATSAVSLTGGLVGVATAIMGSSGVYNAVKKMTKEMNVSSQGLILFTGNMAEAASGGALLGLVLGGPVGAAIGAIGGLLAGGIAGIVGYNSALTELAESKVFGDINISTAEFSESLNNLELSFTGTSSVIEQFKSNMDSLTATFDTNMTQVDGYLTRFQYLGESISGETGEMFKESLNNLFTSANEIIDSGTQYSVQLWATSFQEMTGLTAEEQQKVLQIITDNGNATKTEMQNAQNRINEIWQTAINTRGYLTNEEYAEIQNLLNKIRSLTATEAEKSQADMEYYKKLFSDKSYQLDEESYNNFLEARKSYEQTMRDTIRENYEKRYADAQVQIDNLKEQQKNANSDEYNELQSQIDLLEKTQQEAYNTRLKEEDELKTKLEGYTNDVYTNITGTYLDIYNKTDAESKRIRETIEGIFKNANINPNDIISQFQSIGKNSADSFSNAFNKQGVRVQLDPNAFANGQTSARVTMSVAGYADGGFVDSADLFFANENGIPEMIGRIGNQTAVANNDQITTSITNALTSALDKYDFGNGNSPTIIYLGNKKLYEGYGEHVQRENDRYGTNMIRM